MTLRRICLLQLLFVLILGVSKNTAAGTTMTTQGEHDLWRWMSLTGGPRLGEFPHLIAPPTGSGGGGGGGGGSGLPCAGWAPMGPAWRARIRTGDREFIAAHRRVEPRETAAASSSGTGGIVANSPLPTMYRSPRAAFALSRTRWLGLQHCERLPLADSSSDIDDAAATAASFEDEPLLDALPNAEQSWWQYSVLHHGYSRNWQLWLRHSGSGSDKEASLKEALRVRVLHADSGACMLERRWTADGADVEFQPVSPEDAVFRLPTACYRVEL